MNTLLRVQGEETEWTARLQQAQWFDGLQWGLRRQRTV
jgi:hypothetical protein